MRQPERRANIRGEIRDFAAFGTFGATSFRFYAPSAGTAIARRSADFTGLLRQARFDLTDGGAPVPMLRPQSKDRGRRADVPNVSGLKSVLAGLMHRQQREGAAGYGSESRNDLIAAAQTVFVVERNMSNAAMRGVVVPPGSRATSRAQGSRWNLGGLASDHRPCADLVRIGKARLVADDARAREVGLRHSSCEAANKVAHPVGEQSAAEPAARWSLGSPASIARI
jgi:hypothetical protein